ncbi:MAG: tetratricopeptide repeat protein [Rhizobacter sp.]|nr:tetratricopeptide repeat protein [Rhizobacter sp.]
MATTPQEFLSAGDPAQALAALQAQVRDKPGDAKLRIFLFQLLCVLGQWERAMAQLEVCGQLDAGTLAMVNTYREAIKCEAVRAAVFAGKTTPVVFGKPAEWVALLVQALSHDAQGHPEQARQLREQAFEAAPTTAGSLNGNAFDWIADADSRLGPVLEVVLNGRYTWVPFDALSAVTVEAPEDLRDMVWAPVHLTFANGGDSVALVPTCYPGTREQADGKLKLARGTEWLPAGSEQYVGLGQRVLSTSSVELGLLETREIKFTAP